MLAPTGDGAAVDDADGDDPGAFLEQAVGVQAAGEPLLRSGLLRNSKPRSQRKGEGDAAEPGGEVAP